MFVLSFFLHSILLAGSALDSFQCLRSLLIVSFHVFFGLPRPRCPTTSNSVMLLIQPSFLTTCPNQRSLPIIPYPVTEWSTIFTALTIMGNISKDIMGANHLTTISLDLAIYEKAVQLAYSNNRLAAMYNFRHGELHISMAHLRGIGTYIENSGLDSIWIESNTYGPAVVRSIILCSHYKRCFNAHEVTIAALFAFFLKHSLWSIQRLNNVFVKL